MFLSDGKKNATLCLASFRWGIVGNYCCVKTKLMNINEVAKNIYIYIYFAVLIHLFLDQVCRAFSLILIQM